MAVTSSSAFDGEAPLAGDGVLCACGEGDAAVVASGAFDWRVSSFTSAGSSVDGCLRLRERSLARRALRSVAAA